MNKLAKRALWTAALTGGLWAAGAGVASAAGTDGSEGLGSGNEAVVSISAPVTLGGNALGILGDAETTGSSATTAPAAPAADVSTSGIGGVLSGSAALVALHAPVTVAGNAIGILGDASSDSSNATTTGGSSGSAATTSGDDGLLSGNLGVVDVAAPVTVGGNAVAVVGDATSTGSTVESSAASGGSEGASTGGDAGLVSGNQLVADVLAPVTAGGNAVAVVGDATSTG
ncbi:MAG: chaplin family protein, partial [Actinomycetota bacterium]